VLRKAQMTIKNPRCFDLKHNDPPLLESRVARCPLFGGQVLLFCSCPLYCTPKKIFFKGVFALKNDLFPFCPPFWEVFIEKSSFLSSWTWQPYIRDYLQYFGILRNAKKKLNKKGRIVIKPYTYRKKYYNIIKS
jgi:hypothetical protein